MLRCGPTANMHRLCHYNGRIISHAAELLRKIRHWSVWSFRVTRTDMFLVFMICVKFRVS